jgi:hypothetical protein
MEVALLSPSWKKTTAQADNVTTESYHPLSLDPSRGLFHHPLLSGEGSKPHQQILDEDLMHWE